MSSREGGPSPVAAASEVARFLESRGIPYAVIGGLAVQYWGDPRATRDVDVTVMVADEDLDRFLAAAVGAFSPRVSDVADFAARSRVLLLRSSDDVPIDISLGIPGYEEEVMARAVVVDWPGGEIRMIGAEDLVIHKCVAGRPRDDEDVRSILMRRGGDLDVVYIRRWLSDFADLVPEIDPLTRFEDVLRSIGPGGQAD